MSDEFDFGSIGGSKGKKKKKDSYTGDMPSSRLKKKVRKFIGW